MTQEFGNQENKLKGDYANVEGSLKLMQSPVTQTKIKRHCNIGRTFITFWRAAGEF